MKTLKSQLDFCSFVCTKLADGITHEESLMIPADGKNSINWILGHIVNYRNNALTLFGKETLYPADKFTRYKQGKSPLTDATEATEFPELVACYEKLHSALLEGISQAGPEYLERQAKSGPLGNPEETVGTLLSGLASHESYHLGQIGMLRRMIGKPGNIG